MASAALAPRSAPVTPFAEEDRHTRDLVRDLHIVRPAIYWSDLLCTAALGWTSFGFAVALPFASPGMLASIVLAIFSLYRGLCFLHEISHQSARALPRFEAAWNLLVGYPLLIPSSMYCGVHQNHHSLSTYGTAGDPEYLPFAASRLRTISFAAESFFIPLFLCLRFLLLSLAGFASPRFQRWLVVCMSALTMNLAYRRHATPALVARVRRHSAHILVLWGAVAALATAHRLPWRTFALWLLVSGCVSFINTLRTLGAHAYESPGYPLGREGQLLDSIDTPGALWTELWAPVGLRYHALHHYFPGIPYHNLAIAWRRVSRAFPAGATFHKSQSRGLVHSLTGLVAGHRRTPFTPS